MDWAESAFGCEPMHCDHRVDYYGKANWNLSIDRSHPVSFEHNAQGSGFIAYLAWKQSLSMRWGITVSLESQFWTTDPGLDTDYHILTAGVVQPIYTRLNAVHWRSHAAGFSATYRL